MPPIRSKTKQDSIHQEGRIELAIEAIQNKTISSISAAARTYSISRSTLRDRITGRVSQTNIHANSHELTQFEEDTLKKWILSMDDRGAAPRPSIVREMADLLLALRGTDRVGKNWTGN
ncbi:hypothetical protein N7478_010286 [Penicillium angulare]|uniref:uncharacterized protein n=1 Tax=Penicillium angulare TaxID=116970 RepID=UPI002541364E|nr:uncharacterized protein N7478_010286 [Penicillium angulare]KAJ5267478.1 hypothetical protein N7478_010286 [Penicillium angulare]